MQNEKPAPVGKLGTGHESDPNSADHSPKPEENQVKTGNLCDENGQPFTVPAARIFDDPVTQFRDAMCAAGLAPPANIEADGKMHRFSTNGKRSDDSGWYCLHGDGIPAGAFGDWRTSRRGKWRADIGRDLTPEENQAHRQRLTEIRAASDADRAARHADAAIKAERILDAAQACLQHPYLTRKGVQPHGLGVGGDGRIIVPVRALDGSLTSLQFIAPDGSKKLLTGGRVKGCLHMVGEPGATLCIAEGYATAASIHAATGQAVAVAFNAANLEPVARQLRAKYPHIKIIICGDSDPSGVGQAKAREAANAVGGLVALPEFTADELACEKPPSDWNDFAALRGLAAVKDAIRGAECAPGSRQTETPVKDTAGDFDAAVAALAALKPHEYDRVRTAEAKRLGVRTATLDDAVTGQRTRQDRSGAASLLPDVEPWPDPVNGAALLDEIAGTVKRFIACDQTIADTAALWVSYTWLTDHFFIAPILMITAPEKECGKTTFLNLIGRMAKRPLSASNISPAAIFRVIDAEHPTLLLDETDTFLRKNEEARGIIDSGHTRDSAFVIRLVGDNHTPTRFCTFGAKVLSGIGKLPATLQSRSIIVEMRRKLPGEKIVQMRFAETGLFGRLASQLARFADDAGEAIGQMRPNLPQSLGDRAQDNAEPLLAIADHAGSGWPDRARAALLKIAGAAAEADTLRGGLLQDIQAVFMVTGRDRISTADLLAALIADDTKPWATYARGKPMTPRHLANRLADYRITPGTIRIGGTTAKGFLLSDFAETFARYLSLSPGTPFPSVTPSQPAEILGLCDNLSVTLGVPVTDRKVQNPAETLACDGVTDRNPHSGAGACFGDETASSEYEI